MREQQDIVVIWRQSGRARDESGAAATIVWATGYGYDYGWVRIPVFDARGRPAQQRGVTAVPGLYFLGLHWMHTFKSGLLSGVGDDAEFLADRMSRGHRPYR
jgi:hypothetical protein